MSILQNTNTNTTILKTFIERSNLCTGSWYHDFDSQCVDEEFHMKMLKMADTSIGSPCHGDRGTSLMVKENKRSVSFSMSIQVPVKSTLTGTWLPGCSADASFTPPPPLPMIPTPLCHAAWTRWCTRESARR